MKSKKILKFFYFSNNFLYYKNHYFKINITKIFNFYKKRLNLKKFKKKTQIIITKMKKNFKKCKNNKLIKFVQNK